MKVLLIRHGSAEERESFARTGAPDDQRPLTRKGRSQMRRAARGLKLVVKEINIIATSPLVRAHQTADILAEEFPSAIHQTLDALKPQARLTTYLEWLRENTRRKCVAAVGHDPHISALACQLVGAREGAVQMSEGSALLLEFDDELRSGAAALRWFMTAEQLSMMMAE